MRKSLFCISLLCFHQRNGSFSLLLLTVYIYVIFFKSRIHSEKLSLLFLLLSCPLFIFFSRNVRVYLVLLLLEFEIALHLYFTSVKTIQL